MISNRCARKSLVTNCNSIISKNYLRFLVDSNVIKYSLIISIETSETEIYNAVETEINNKIGIPIMQEV